MSNNFELRSSDCPVPTSEIACSFRSIRAQRRAAVLIASRLAAHLEHYGAACDAPPPLCYTAIRPAPALRLQAGNLFV